MCSEVAEATEVVTEDMQQAMETVRHLRWHCGQLQKTTNGELSTCAVGGTQFPATTDVEQPLQSWGHPAANEAWHIPSPTLVWVVDGWTLEELQNFQHQDAVCREALRWVRAEEKPDRKLISAFDSKRKML